MKTASILGAQKIATLTAIAREIAMRGIPGHVAEIGVYKGGVLAELAGIFPARRVLGFDTFEGLPAAHLSDRDVIPAGMFGDARFEDVRERMQRFANVELVRGLFPDTGADVDGAFAFVHLDVDFYLATLRSLEYLVPRMSPGGAIVLDDWDWPQCPGVRTAVEEMGLRAHQTMVYQSVIRIANPQE